MLKISTQLGLEHIWNAYLACTKPQAQCSALQKTKHGREHACNPSTWEVKVGGSEIQDQKNKPNFLDYIFFQDQDYFQLHSKFKANWNT